MKLEIGRVAVGCIVRIPQDVLAYVLLHRDDERKTDVFTVDTRPLTRRLQAMYYAIPSNEVVEVVKNYEEFALEGMKRMMEA